MTERSVEKRPGLGARVVDGVRNYFRERETRYHNELMEAMDSLAAEGRPEVADYEVALRDAQIRFSEFISPELYQREARRGLNQLVKNGALVSRPVMETGQTRPIWKYRRAENIEKKASS